MGGAVTVSAALEADPANVGRARAVLRDAMSRSGAERLVDSAAVVLSEVLTNAFVHVGGVVQVHVWATADSVRVEVEDHSKHMPARRHYAATAGTGRGVQLMDDLADRWGAARKDSGKVVWFEMGHHPVLPRDGTPSSERSPATGEVLLHARSDDPDRAPSPVTLRQFPMLMHVAWQEHAATLLREYLLHVLDEDPDILEKHAQASAAMSLLHDQLPAPVLSNDPSALMADAIEPNVTVDEVVLEVPGEAVAQFDALDVLLRQAILEAREGRFLSPPTQPEIDDMREWLCAEVARQAGGDTMATPWLARTDVRATLADQATLTATYAGLAAVGTPLLATDESSIIVAASPAALELLGYSHADDLLGRRVIVVVPQRFHQAHIAGTTLHATNGRDNLLGVPVRVPMVRADGSEVPVDIEVRAERLHDGQRVFVARFHAIAPSAE